MKKGLSPSAVAVRVGTIAGLVSAMLVLAVGVNRLGDGSGALADAITAFMIGGGIVGGIAAFVQSHRLHRSAYDNPPPGWYDAPTNDGTQWYWSGTRWTERTRPFQERIRKIDSRN